MSPHRRANFRQHMRNGKVNQRYVRVQYKNEVDVKEVLGLLGLVTGGWVLYILTALI